MARFKTSQDPSLTLPIVEGDIWINPNTNDTLIWDGESWGTPLDSDEEDESDSQDD